MTTTREPTDVASPPAKAGLSGSLGFLLGNGVGFPALFAVCAVILVLFAVGLVAMAKRIPKRGGFFTFVG
jgi:hypothetical protein